MSFVIMNDKILKLIASGDLHRDIFSLTKNVYDYLNKNTNYPEYLIYDMHQYHGHIGNLADDTLIVGPPISNCIATRRVIKIPTIIKFREDDESSLFLLNFSNEFKKISIDTGVEARAIIDYIFRKYKQSR